MWTDHEVSQTSRLILVLDTAKSNYWVPLVRKTSIAYVGKYSLFVCMESFTSCMYAKFYFLFLWKIYLNCCVTNLLLPE